MAGLRKSANFQEDLKKDINISGFSNASLYRDQAVWCRCAPAGPALWALAAGIWLILGVPSGRFRPSRGRASRRDVLGNGEMAEKLPVIIDNRGDNKVLHALQRLLPNLRTTQTREDDNELQPAG